MMSGLWPGRGDSYYGFPVSSGSQAFVAPRFGP
jgi:hypothetical protein